MSFNGAERLVTKSGINNRNFCHQHFHCYAKYSIQFSNIDRLGYAFREGNPFQLRKVIEPTPPDSKLPKMDEEPSHVVRQFRKSSSLPDYILIVCSGDIGNRTFLKQGTVLRIRSRPGRKRRSTAWLRLGFLLRSATGSGADPLVRGLARARKRTGVA